MDKKSLTYSAVLLLGLVFVSILLNRGIIQSVHDNSHITLATDQSVYSQGGEIIFTGEIEFSLNEQVDIKAVRLKNLSGPTPLDVALPLAPTSGVYVNIPVASGTLMVKVDFLGITGGTSSNSTIPGTTIPGTTLPGGSDDLKGVTSASKIVYTAKWSPTAGNSDPTLGAYVAKLFVDLKNGTKLESSGANYTIIAGPVVAISGPAWVNEASSTATYIIKVTPPSTTTTVIVGYKTVNGTAVAGQDFTGASTTAIITTGQATTTVTIAITDDAIDESDENFSVVLTSTDYGTLDPRPANTRIIDNDAAVTVTLASTTAAINEGNSGTTTISVPVTLSAAAGRDVTVSYATKDGTATAGSDYVAKSGIIVFPAGVTSKPISVVINGDTDAESNETFVINISNAFAPKMATDTIAIINATTTVTITNDEVAEVLTTRLKAAIGSGGRAVVEVYVDNIKNPTTGSTSTAIAGGVRSFSGKVTFSSASIEILGVQDAAGFTGTVFATSTDQATFSASATSQTSTTSPILVAKLLVILTGSKNATTTLTLDSLSIVASSTGATISQDPSAKATDTYQRGNTRADTTTVNIFDALFAAQCTVGVRSFGTDSPSSQCHPINATTPRHDGTSGDKISIFDALFIAQAVVGQKDEFFK